MGLRMRLVVTGFIPAMLMSLAACSGGSATTAPAASPSSAASPSAAASAAAPSSGLPSANASALASSGTGGGSGSLPDPASLLTADMAASVIGGSPTRMALPGTAGAMSIVSYSNAGGDNVTFLIERLPTAIGAAALQAAIQAAGAQGNLQAVSGIGDAAGKVVDSNGATVAFIKGNTLAAIEASASGMAGTDLEAKLEALAQQIAGKL